MTESNPFLALFSNEAANAGPAHPSIGLTQDKERGADNGDSSSFDKLAENVFMLTLKPNRKKDCPLYYMQDLAGALKLECFDQTALDQAVLEYAVGLQDSLVNYLFQCFERYHSIGNKSRVSGVHKTIFVNLDLALSQPELFPKQNLHEDFIQLLAFPIEETTSKFLEDFIKHILEQENSSSVAEVFEPVLLCLKTKLASMHLLVGNQNGLDAMLVMSKNPALAKAIVLSSILDESSVKVGRQCEDTLLGSLFLCSCIPRVPGTTSDFFDRPSRSPPSVHVTTEGNIWAASERIMDKTYKIFYNLFKSSPEVQDLTRKWLGQVLALNKARGQMWAQHDTTALVDCASDGFMTNLGAVLLQLCRPFCSQDDPKAYDRLSKIDASFCAAKVTDGNGVHIADLHKETCLITQENRPMARTLPYSFSTELFFLTHRALELGAKAVHSQMLQMSQNFSRLQRAYQDAEQSGQTPVVQQIQERMDVMMSSYLCFKAVLLVPEWLKLHFEFILATSKWLCASALGTHPSNVTSSELSSNKEQTSELLSCIPEFCLSNVMDFVVFANRFSPTTLDRSKLDDLLTLVLVFMGSPNRLKNPHMRAAMAEMLDGLMPPDRGQASPPSSRTKLFVEHPRSKDVVRTLLHVFASIEMTGQGVAFEQKFNYRRPMYAAMKFLWSLKFHRRQFKLLAAEAEANMEAAQPPLFLQFVNLLINDAIYLLDEGLSYMAQLKEQQIQRSDGSWPNVAAGPQRHQREATYQHITMLARFHNLMGRETIRILDMMTTEVKGVFVHSAMVDRVASMLNYFLLHLVGPKKRDFKVKDFGDYEFDPAELVSCICQIYCHLSDADEFCTAVSQDGRSYSSQLFELAEDVLSRIGRGALIGDLRLVAEKVAKLATAQASDEDLISAAPDEFLDPIMSSVMMNPVILPSSRVTVDRSTIARHLLSDQSDPFNRSPLTMEEILPDDELRKKIHQWISEVKKKAVLRDDRPT
ncbi:ubiquitin conjugation factor E4 A isoform X1 [Daphnia magna]|nr:ubiquitin conjugation factor E4 A isoform X1 [Daphnia magna]KAK4037381.1 hypothetical protein OUZ56_029418 [Daphnia magna]KZS20359.1 Ubiquitin conjugation factor E4 A [Daphnia magna]